MVIRVVENPARVERQDENRWRSWFWAPVPELDGRYHRVVGIDIDNASRKVQLRRLIVSGLDGDVEGLAG